MVDLGHQQSYVIDLASYVVWSTNTMHNILRQESMILTSYVAMCIIGFPNFHTSNNLKTGFYGKYQLKCIHITWLDVKRSKSLKIPSVYNEF